MSDIGLLQLFDMFGLPPSINYTEASISRHKQKVLGALQRIGTSGQKPSFQFKVNNTTHVYDISSITNAFAQLLRIIQIRGLAFHPVSESESWESHWNPLVDEWEKPIPNWNYYVGHFFMDRREQSEASIEVSARSEYYTRVARARDQDEIEQLKELLTDTQRSENRQQIEWL
jgi:hypothetical protein